MGALRLGLSHWLGGSLHNEAAVCWRQQSAGAAMYLWSEC